MIKKSLFAIVIAITSTANSMQDPEITISINGGKDSIKVEKSIAQRIPLWGELLEHDDAICMDEPYATKKSIEQIITIAQLFPQLMNLKDQESNEVKCRLIEEKIANHEEARELTSNNLQNQISYYEQRATKNNQELLQEMDKCQRENSNDLKNFYNQNDEIFDIKGLKADGKLKIHQLRHDIFNFNNETMNAMKKLDTQRCILRNTKYHFCEEDRKIVRNFAQTLPLLEQIQTIMLADYTSIPMDLITPMIEGLNHEQPITGFDLHEMTGYKGSPFICQKITYQLLNNPQPIESIQFPFVKNKNAFYIENLESCGHTAVAFSPDGKNIVFGCWKSAKLLNIDTKQIEDLPLNPLHLFIEDIQFNPQGTMIGIIGSNKKFITYDIKKNKATDHWVTFKCSSNFAFSHDGTHFALGDSHGTIRLYNAQDVHSINSWQGSNLYIKSLAFSKDYLAHSDEQNVKICDPKTGNVLRTLHDKDGSFIDKIIFNNEGTSLAAGSHSMVKIWDPATGNFEKKLSDPILFGRIRDIAFTPDNTKLIVGYDYEEDDFTVWDLKYCKPLRSFNNNKTSRKFAINPSGELLANASYDGKVTLWKFTEHQKLSLGQTAFILYHKQQMASIKPLVPTLQGQQLLISKLPW